MAGAAIAMATIMAATIPQKAENGARRMNLRIPRRMARRRLGATDSGWATVVVMSVYSLQPDPGVENGDGHIDQDIQQDEHGGIEKHQVLHNEDVTFAHRREHRETQPWCTEGALDGHRSCQHQTE